MTHTTHTNIHTQIYGYTPPWALPWNFRKRNLLREVLMYKADIMALQEIQVVKREKERERSCVSVCA
jgi:mRNA deadenylase 3'-5' endonuclease subunit Ccr4